MSHKYLYFSPYLYFFNNRGSHPCYYVYFNKLLRLENVELFSIQVKILYILDIIILILYRKLYINIVSIIVLNIEARQYKIKINLAVWYSSSFNALLKHVSLFGTKSIIFYNY